MTTVLQIEAATVGKLDTCFAAPCSFPDHMNSIAVAAICTQVYPGGVLLCLGGYILFSVWFHSDSNVCFRILPDFLKIFVIQHSSISNPQDSI